MREKNLFRKITFCGGANRSAEKCSKRIKKDTEKSHTAVNLDKQRNKRKPHKCFRCRSKNHIIKPPKDNNKKWKQFRFSERIDCALQNNEIMVIMMMTKIYMHL